MRPATDKAINVKNGVGDDAAVGVRGRHTYTAIHHDANRDTARLGDSHAEGLPYYIYGARGRRRHDPTRTHRRDGQHDTHEREREQELN
jgi:hypothetical protein